MVSPADIVTSDGSKIKFPFDPMVMSTAHAGAARKSVAKNANMNFIEFTQLQYILHTYAVIPRICFNFLTYHCAHFTAAFTPFFSCLFRLLAMHIKVP